MKKLPSKDQNPNGLYNKYELYKTDGSNIDSKAEYFILRVDDASANDSIETRAHREACRQAVLKYAELIEPILPELSKDILKRYS